MARAEPAGGGVTINVLAHATSGALTRIAAARLIDDGHCGDGPRHDLSESISALARAGALRAVLPPEKGGVGLGHAPGTARALCDLLRRVGRADLSLARLYEGHVNAAVLVEVHGGTAARERMRGLVAGGAVLGVWGADGPRPLEWRSGPGGAVRLRGRKRFASGLGIVTHAIVTARADEAAAQRMFLIPAGDRARHDPDAWTASAMRATRSGGFDATGIEPGADAAIGAPGALMVEPHFEGGIWRYCAAQVGGAEGLVEAWADHLRRTRRLDDPVQRQRLGRAMAAAHAARATVEAAALAVEESAGAAPDRIASAVARALLAREAVEALCTEVLTLSERALGMAAHDARSPLDRMRRDLSLFLRQAAPDAKLDRAVSAVLDGPGLGELT